MVGSFIGLNDSDVDAVVIVVTGAERAVLEKIPECLHIAIQLPEFL